MEQQHTAETADSCASALPQPDAERPENVHGLAVRSLIAQVQNGQQMTVLKNDQNATLDELQRLKQGIETLNKQSAEQYNAMAPEFIRAARLAAQVKGDLNDISARLHSIQTKINELQALKQKEHDPR